MEFLATMREIDASLADAGEAFTSMRAELDKQFDALEQATTWMLRTGMSDPNAILAGSTPYLRMWGLCISAWLLARGAVAAEGTGDADLAETQLVLARFFAEQILPQCSGLLGSATAGAGDLFALDDARL